MKSIVRYYQLVLMRYLPDHHMYLGRFTSSLVFHPLLNKQRQSHIHWLAGDDLLETTTGWRRLLARDHCMEITGWLETMTGWRRLAGDHWLETTGWRQQLAGWRPLAGDDDWLETTDYWLETTDDWLARDDLCLETTTGRRSLAGDDDWLETTVWRSLAGWRPLAGDDNWLETTGWRR